ncbi:hypothetical protein B0H14DRAFT_3852210 [Mycena olivaceomarginata]|nr:hypothetical protein B0H14DRAFT_3852210 [Mycena olivaceomarginata]
MSIPPAAICAHSIPSNPAPLLRPPPKPSSSRAPPNTQVLTPSRPSSQSVLLTPSPTTTREIPQTNPFLRLSSPGPILAYCAASTAPLVAGISNAIKCICFQDFLLSQPVLPRMLHPDDPLALIVGEAGAAAAPVTALTSTNRLAGIPDLTTSAGGPPSRSPQTPADTRRQAIPHPFGRPGVSMDTLLSTPTEFTFRSRPLSRNSGLRLAPLNLPASGTGHHHSSSSSGINGWS